MITVGLTGGIGSGKSTIAKAFNKLGVPIYYADTESKILVNTNRTLIERLIREFGADIYNDFGIDKNKFASLIFSNQKMLKKANEIIHPIVFEDFLKWKSTFAEEQTKYIIKESAILFESNANKLVDYTITVSADSNTRINRVCKRDNLTNEEVKKRIENQLSDHERESMSDFIIYNDNGILLLPQILKIHKTLLQYGKVL